MPQETTAQDKQNHPRFKIDEKGNVEFNGDFNTAESLEMIKLALEQAQYYKQKSHQLESEKIKSAQQTDLVYIIFGLVCAGLISLLVYMGVSALSGIFANAFNQNVEVRENVR